jgi:long-chain acyl-CoA synthetase
MKSMKSLEPQIRGEIHYDGRNVQCFFPRPSGFHALLEEAVSNHPDGEALVCGDQRLSYRELDAEVGRVAAGLAARGVGKGDRVALLLGNRIEFVVAIFAASRLGAIWVPLNIRDQLPGLTHMLRDSGACLLVAEDTLLERVPAADATPALRNRIVIGSGTADFEPYAGLRAGEPIREAVPTDEEDVAAILYTSGTTGLAKGAMLTNLGIVHSAMHFHRLMELNEQDRSIVSVPLAHVTGSIAIIATLVRASGTVIIMPAFNATEFLKLAERERMTHTVLVPAQYHLFLLQADHREYDLSAWRIGGFGGAPMPAITIGRLAEWLPGLRLMNLYGATETTSPATAMPSTEIGRRPDSVGLPVECGEIWIMDANGELAPRGTPGEIWIAGPMVVPGYWRNPEATAREFSDGFWHSGDIGSIDEDGYIRVFDRLKDVINRGGYKIYTTEVENVLLAHGDVAEAAAIGKPCPVLGERVHAFIVPREGKTPDLDGITAECARLLSDYKVPESFTVSDTPLPRNPNGKVLKRQLRERLTAPGEDDLGKGG